MDWGKTFDFAPRSGTKPRKGRRAGGILSPQKSDTSSDDNLSSPTAKPQSSGIDSAAPVAPPRSRRTGGWAEDIAKSGKRRSAINMSEEGKFRGAKKDDSDDDIPIIPDLDDIQDDEIGSDVAHAPSVAVNRAAAYRELDSDLLKHAAFATLDDINLQLLTKCLSLESEVKEPDEVWTWDHLFTDVSSELNKEMNLYSGSTTQLPREKSATTRPYTVTL